MRGVAGVCGREKCACDWFIRGGEGESRKKEGVDVEGVCVIISAWDVHVT